MSELGEAWVRVVTLMPSLERIDPLRGYHLDNVLWVCCEFNVSERAACMNVEEGAGLDRGWCKDKVDIAVASLRASLDDWVLSGLSEMSLD
jgi:hypothetical protein